MYPAGIITRSVVITPAIVLEDGEVLVTRVAVRASRSLVWLDSMTVVVADETAVVVNATTGTRTLELPVTDQDGYGDAQGGSYVLAPSQHTHAYAIRIDYVRDEVVGWREYDSVVLPQGDGSPVHLAALVPSNTGSFVLAPPVNGVELIDSNDTPVDPPSTYLRFVRDDDGDVQQIILGTAD